MKWFYVSIWLIDIWISLIVIGVFIVVQNYYFGFKDYGGGVFYMFYNNYCIFFELFFYLFYGQDFYKYWFVEYWDLYKYSLVFVLFMVFFVILFDFVGLLFWNVFNIVVFGLVLRMVLYYMGKNFFFFCCYCCGGIGYLYVKCVG